MSISDGFLLPIKDHNTTLVMWFLDPLLFPVFLPVCAPINNFPIVIPDRSKGLHNCANIYLFVPKNVAA